MAKAKRPKSTVTRAGGSGNTVKIGSGVQAAEPAHPKPGNHDRPVEPPPHPPASSAIANPKDVIQGLTPETIKRICETAE